MLELVIVRHGESTRNHACYLARQGDPTLLERQLRQEPDEATWPLTDEGRAQAQMAGDWIRANVGAFDAGYCSPFRRTVETADCLDLGLSWTLDERLREREWGVYPVDGADAYTWEQYLHDLNLCSVFTWKSQFPGAESVEDLLPAAKAFVDDLYKAHPTGRVAIVSHGGRMIALEQAIEGSLPSRVFRNCCVYQVRIDGGGVSRIVYPAQPGTPPTEWRPFGS